MAESSRLSPEELDRLEDALEGLEHLDEIEDPSPVVAARLLDFRTILAASREALPLEDVPAGLLDGVLREARLSPEDSGVNVAPEVEAPARSWWSRWRKGLLLPGLAVAGSAALVLLLVRPQLDAGPQMDDTGQIVSANVPRGQAAPAAEVEADGVDADEEVSAAPLPPPSAAAPAEPAVEAEPEAEPEIIRTFEDSKKAESPPTEAKPSEAPGELGRVSKVPGTTAPAKSDSGASSGWDAIEQGDRARKGNDCFTARNHYARALDDGNDSVRARAYVGMGLCKASEGDDAAAAEYLDQAEELDPESADYAGTQSSERKAKPSAPRPSRKRRAKKRSSADAPNDPFDSIDRK